MLKSLWPLGIILLLCVIFFWKFFFQGLIPFPGDLMVGSYYPWLDHKWGYVVGVPVKNSLTSDPFSQIYIWKQIVLSELRQLHIPLWNPYSYAGYPLLGNFQSGALDPLNSLLFLGHETIGWSLYIIFSFLGSGITMYFFLRLLSLSKPASLVASVSYSFSGFSLVNMTLGYVGHVLIWIPLSLLSLSMYLRSERLKYLIWLGASIVLIISPGHFQSATYALGLIVSYAVYLAITGQASLDRKKIFGLTMAFALGIGLTFIQLLPTLETYKLSIRNLENYAQSRNFGLLPAQNLITSVAPDFFGNPGTGNFWGYLDYLETQHYAGVLGLTSLVFVLQNRSKFKKWYFFLSVLLATLVLGYDNPVSRLFFQLKIPGLGTSMTGRIFILHCFATAVITGAFVDNIKFFSLRKLLKPLIILFILLIGIGLTTIILKHVFVNYNFESVLDVWIQRMLTGARNTVLPLLLLVGLGVGFVFRRSKFGTYIIFALVVFDLFRFGWKFTPFVNRNLVFPKEPVISWLLDQPGFFRIDRERGELMPPNTWAYYGLSSPSGYDPLASLDYVQTYEKEFHDSSSISRYSELNWFDAKALGKFNVKYLLAIKRDPTGRPVGDGLSYKIDTADWEKVFETPSTAVLENRHYQERVRLESPGSAQITSYSPNRVVIDYDSTDNNTLILADSWYPGWHAKVNSLPAKVEKYPPIWRSVNIPQGTGRVEFYYLPQSFIIGLIVTTISWLGAVSLAIYVKRSE